jgi:hypothetical protein
MDRNRMMIGLAIAVFSGIVLSIFWRTCPRVRRSLRRREQSVGKD